MPDDTRCPNELCQSPMTENCILSAGPNGIRFRCWSCGREFIEKEEPKPAAMPGPVDTVKWLHDCERSNQNCGDDALPMYFVTVGQANEFARQVCRQAWVDAAKETCLNCRERPEYIGKWVHRTICLAIPVCGMVAKLDAEARSVADSATTEEVGGAG